MKIEQDGTGSYIATVPALRGCVSEGSTPEDAVKNIREAISGWLDAEDARVVSELPEVDRNVLIAIAV